MDRDFLEEMSAKTDRVDSRESAVSNVLSDLGKEQAKLAELAHILADKMSGVLRSPWGGHDAKLANPNVSSKDIEGHSPLVRALSDHVARNRDITDIINYLINNLEA